MEIIVVASGIFKSKLSFYNLCLSITTLSNLDI